MGCAQVRQLGEQLGGVGGIEDDLGVLQVVDLVDLVDGCRLVVWFRVWGEVTAAGPVGYGGAELGDQIGDSDAAVDVVAGWRAVLN